MSEHTLPQSEEPTYSENYRGFAIELRPAGGEWVARATGPVQWVTPTRRTWIGALFHLYDLVDKYERAQAFCRLNRLQAPATGAVNFVAAHPVVRS